MWHLLWGDLWQVSSKSLCYNIRYVFYNPNSTRHSSTRVENDRLDFSWDFPHPGYRWSTTRKRRWLRFCHQYQNNSEKSPCVTSSRFLTGLARSGSISRAWTQSLAWWRKRSVPDKALGANWLRITLLINISIDELWWYWHYGWSSNILLLMVSLHWNE